MTWNELYLFLSVWSQDEQCNVHCTVYNSESYKYQIHHRIDYYKYLKPLLVEQGRKLKSNFAKTTDRSMMIIQSAK